MGITSFFFLQPDAILEHLFHLFEVNAVRMINIYIISWKLNLKSQRYKTHLNFENELDDWMRMKIQSSRSFLGQVKGSLFCTPVFR